VKDKIKKWVEKDGRVFLKEVGLKIGQTVLDFGSGSGHYAIPASRVVGKDGKVYAFDKDNDALRELEETVRRFGLKNIELINGDTKVSLEDNSVDVVLCYDVIHYLKNRKVIYDEVYRVLRPSGFLSLYPKHHKEDYPLMELANIDLDKITEEVEEANFIFERKFSKRLLHDEYYNEGYILNFKTKKREGAKNV